MSGLREPEFYYAGLERYDLARAEEDHVLDPVLPAEVGKVHATPYRTNSGQRLREIHFETGPYAGHYTLCARSVRVILTQEFDPGDPDACPRCVSAWLEQQSRGSSKEGPAARLEE